VRYGKEVFGTRLVASIEYGFSFYLFSFKQAHHKNYVFMNPKGWHHSVLASDLEVVWHWAGIEQQPFPLFTLSSLLLPLNYRGRTDMTIEVGLGFLFRSLFALLGVRKQAPNPRTVLFLPHDM
jgi:hypothetical protein